MDAVQQIVTDVTHKNTFDDPTRTSFVALWTVFVIMALASVTFLGQIFTSKHPNTLGSPIKRHCKPGLKRISEFNSLCTAPAGSVGLA